MDARGLLDPGQRAQCLDELQGDGTSIMERFAPGGLSDAPSDLLPAPWSAIREAAGPDLTIGAHTMTHRHLMRLSTGEVEREIAESHRVVSEALGVPVEHFAYPYGIVSTPVVEAARRVGCATAVTLKYGPAKPGADLLALPRITVPGGAGPAKVEAWASGLRWMRSR
jgi:hypothetical protein